MALGKAQLPLKTTGKGEGGYSKEVFSVEDIDVPVLDVVTLVFLC